jgi:hypothetical protein
VGLNEKVFKRKPIRNFAFDKLDAGREQIATAVAQIVKNQSLVPFFGKQPRDCTTYVPGTSCNQYLHKKDCPFTNTFDNLESITIG